MYPNDEVTIVGLKIWQEELAGLTADEIATGFKNIPDDFAPSPKKFRKLCLANNMGAYKAYEKEKIVKSDPEKAKQAMKDIKKIMGKSK